MTETETRAIQPFEPFFAMRSLSPSASEIHLVGDADLAAARGDAILIELATFVRSCLEVLGDGNAEIVQIGERGRWQGIRVSVDAALLDRIARQVCPRLHDTLAGCMRSLYPSIDVVWRPR